jgi:hypothetical protein
MQKWLQVFDPAYFDYMTRCSYGGDAYDCVTRTIPAAILIVL